ncbi:MAG TPA: BMP family ABC transporter substrate-binding protein [Firmicutes bacterium]|nr:BMP family ABC transporter substrate-binding protein [Bacillota bacterium]
MKKFISMFTVAMFAVVTLAACGGNATGDDSSNGETPKDETNGTQVKVGMMTDSGTIDDKSFNQGTWSGIERYAQDFPSTDKKYVQPGGEATEDYLAANDNLVTAGYEIIVAPGFKFEEAIYEAQEANPNTKYILIDGAPTKEIEKDNFETIVGENTVSIYFNEQEAGFLAGIAAALETKTGKLGFIGGMPIPPVQKFGYGFLAGVAYANENFGTSAEVLDYQYQGTFSDVPAGQTLAGGMYDKGIDVVFHAAGGVGVGVINEAKTRAENGEEVFVIGVDVDQYADGVISDGSSVILTSAIKRIDNAAYDYIKAFAEGNFPGGETIVMDAKMGGVGLPEENPNLAEETTTKTDEALELIKDGTIVVPSTAEELATYLDANGYDASNINY